MTGFMRDTTGRRFIKCEQLKNQSGFEEEQQRASTSSTPSTSSTSTKKQTTQSAQSKSYDSGQSLPSGWE